MWMCVHKTFTGLNSVPQNICNSVKCIQYIHSLTLYICIKSMTLFLTSFPFQLNCTICKHREKPGSVQKLEPEPPQIVRLANTDPPSSLTAEEVQRIESEVSNLTKSMSTCQDDGIRAVFLCRRGALLRKVYIHNLPYCYLIGGTLDDLYRILALGYIPVYIE